MNPASPRRVVLDTDTFNEVDDQFALAHLLLSPEVIDLEAIYAAPFLNGRSTSPGDGMEKSYDEIFRVLDLVQPAHRPPVFRGSDRFFSHAADIVKSAVVDDLIARASEPREDKLFVLTIGAPTNIASALLAAPHIAENIVVVWLGGHAPYLRITDEFNMRQDIHSSRVLLECQVPLVLVPCHPVTSHLITTVAELEAKLAPKGKLGAFLAKRVAEYSPNPPGWSKVIWDIAVSAWAINSAWVPTEPTPCPVLLDDLTWDPNPGPNRRSIEVATWINRDAIFADIYEKVARCG